MKAVEQFFLDQKRSISILLLLLGCVLFLYLKLSAINVMFDRNFPPSIDDSYQYISTIDRLAKFGFNYEDTISYKTIARYIKKNPSPEGFSALGKLKAQYYFSWSFVLSLICKTGVSAEKVYHRNFYAGIFIALIVFIYFGYKMVGFEYIGFFLLSIMLFFGDGGYHGFFWVVPSFYSLIFLFLLVAIVFFCNNYTVKLVFFLPLFLLVHPLSLMSIPVFCLIFILYIFFEKRIDKDFVLRTITFFFISAVVIGICLALVQWGILAPV